MQREELLRSAEEFNTEMLQLKQAELKLKSATQKLKQAIQA